MSEQKGTPHLINVRVGTGNSEVINIRAGEQIVGLGECGDKMLNSIGDKHAP